MKAGDQLILGFRQIERDAIGFGESGDQKQDETEDLRERHLEDAPPGHESEVETLLAVDDLAQAESVQDQQRCDQGESHRQFVADHLRGASQAAHQRIFIVRRPTGQRDAVDAQS